MNPSGQILSNLAALELIHFRHPGDDTWGKKRMSGVGSLLKEAWEIVPVLILLLAGVVIALQSGVGHAASRQGIRQVVGNLSQITLRILGYVAVLLTLQHCIGLRPSLGW